MVILDRIAFAFAVIMGRVQLSSNNTELNVALENLKNVVASASAAADRLIAKSASDAAALADANAQIANIEAEGLAVVQPLADKLNGAAPEA